MTRPTREEVLDDLPPLSLAEAAEWWCDLSKEITDRRRELEVASGALLRALDAAEAKEIAEGDFLIKKTESWNPYEWDLQVLHELARPLLTPIEWRRAVKVIQVPASEEVEVQTAPMKAALLKKGIVGKDVLRRAMTRKLKTVGVKVERVES
jgi:hypothetical protein